MYEIGELEKLNSNKSNQPIKKWATEPKREFQTKMKRKTDKPTKK